MDLIAAIRSRRSCRAFDGRPVEKDKVDIVLEAAHWAPSPANNQPWEFIVVTGQASRQRLYELSEQARHSGRIEIRGFSYVRPLPGQVSGEKEDEALKHYSLAFLKSVPVIIGVVGLPATAVRQAGPQQTADSYKFACAAAIENMLLAATSLGLGSLWFTLFDQDLMRQFLHVEPDRHLVALVCLGYAAYEPPSPGRVPLASKVRRLD